MNTLAKSKALSFLKKHDIVAETSETATILTSGGKEVNLIDLLINFKDYTQPCSFCAYNSSYIPKSMLHD